MKFSERWLREWLKLDISTDELSDQLTMIGHEVEEVEKVAGDFNSVVVGKVVECESHPDADKLRVTKIDVGQPELLQIVCGAANCRQGLVVACALVGANLPGDFKIKPAKLRGVDSQGMLCSYQELGINIEESGIIELPSDAPIGQDVREYLQLNDNMIEVSITPNRADCLSLIGIARDLSAVNRSATLAQVDAKTAPVSIDDKIAVSLDEPDAAPKYLARIIKNIDINAKTPLWMKEKLRRGGIRSIDPVVDVTNFVLLELGHPMHAFDLNQIDGDIHVRYSQKDEKLTLLDGSEVTLKDKTLIIADSKKALALAGIFGGKDSSVTASTNDILLESAYFSPIAIAGKAREYGLHTDASHRYERGVDPKLQLTALERATNLLLEICGGHAGPVVTAFADANLPKSETITLRRDKLDSVIGHFIDDNHVLTILTKLGCEISQNQNSWQVTAPSWRFDMKIEEDLIEEIARIYGYNNIPNQNLTAELLAQTKENKHENVQRIKQLLVDHSYQEAITYSFVDPKIQQLIHPNEDAIILPNPISVDMSAMRLSLWTGLINAAMHNKNRQQHRIRLFETGLKFIPDATSNLGINQQEVIAGLVMGSIYDEHWAITKKEADFFDVKGDVNALLSLNMNLADITYQKGNHSALHPGQNANIYYKNEQIGVIGALHPAITAKLGLDGKAYVFELSLNKIIQEKEKTIVPVSKFPANRRDISIIVDKNVNVGDVLAVCKSSCGELLVDINLFDLYQGDNIDANQKSLAISLILQDNTKTLVDKDISSIVNACIKELAAKFNASLRE